MAKYNGLQRTATICAAVTNRLVTDVNGKFFRICYQILQEKHVLITKLNDTNLNAVVVLDKFSARELNSKLWQLA